LKIENIFAQENQFVKLKMVKNLLLKNKFLTEIKELFKSKQEKSLK